MGHTPTPWRIEQDTTLIWGDCDPDDTSDRGMGYPIAECRVSPVSSLWAKGPDYDEGEANAAYIVECVNSHASLVEEVERLREACSALLAHWDKNDGKEKLGEYEGVQYWSPAGRMVDTDYIVAIREALEKTNA